MGINMVQSFIVHLPHFYVWETTDFVYKSYAYTLKSEYKSNKVLHISSSNC